MEESEKAHYLVKKGVGFYTKHFPDGHLDHAWATSYLGNSYIEIGNYIEAKNLLEKILMVYQKNYGENHGGRLRIETYLAKALIKLGHYKEAKRILNHIIRCTEELEGSTSIKLATITKLLAEVHLLENHMEDFENLIKKALKIFNQRKHPDVSKALESLATLYLKRSTTVASVQEAKVFKNRATALLNQALETGKEYFSADSSYIKRVQLELKKNGAM